MIGFVHASLERARDRRIEHLSERTGGPRNRPSRAPRPTNSAADRPSADVWTSVAGSHMPLDTVPHWNWRNPLNLLPLSLLLLVLIALVALLL